MSPKLSKPHKWNLYSFINKTYFVNSLLLSTLFKGLSIAASNVKQKEVCLPNDYTNISTIFDALIDARAYAKKQNWGAQEHSITRDDYLQFERRCNVSLERLMEQRLVISRGTFVNNNTLCEPFDNCVKLLILYPQYILMKSFLHGFLPVTWLHARFDIIIPPFAQLIYHLTVEMIIKLESCTFTQIQALAITCLKSTDKECAIAFRAISKKLATIITPPVNQDISCEGFTLEETTHIYRVQRALFHAVFPVYWLSSRLSMPGLIGGPATPNTAINSIMGSTVRVFYHMIVELIFEKFFRTEKFPPEQIIELEASCLNLAIKKEV